MSKEKDCYNFVPFFRTQISLDAATPYFQLPIISGDLEINERDVVEFRPSSYQPQQVIITGKETPHFDYKSEELGTCNIMMWKEDDKITHYHVLLGAQIFKGVEKDFENSKKVLSQISPGFLPPIDLFKEGGPLDLSKRFFLSIASPTHKSPIMLAVNTSS